MRALPDWLHPMGWLSSPAALWAAAVAVPALLAIYLLRDRFRDLPVSALFLWRDAAPHQRGGRRRRRLRTPPPFFLELLVLLLLILAAAGPRWRSGGAPPDLVVVLDDSYSMAAGGPDSPRQRGEEALQRLVGREEFSRVRLILAAQRPRLLAPAEGTTSASTLAEVLQGWRAGAPAAAVGAAVSLATQIAGGVTGQQRLVVITDRPPPQDDGEGGLREGIEWWAFGAPRPNLALVNAARAEESTLFEIANLGNTPASAHLSVAVGEPAPSRHSFELAPGEVTRLRLRLPGAGAGRLPVVAQLPPDALEADNRAVLLPPTKRPVVVAVAADPQRWRPLVAALEAGGRVRVRPPTDPDVELLFTDRPQAFAEVDSSAAQRWTVVLRSPVSAVAYLGPFVLDRRHPLTEGLELAGVIWAAGDLEAGGGGGIPIVSAGNVPLVTVAERGGRPWLTLHLVPELSTVVRSPAWPALVWNLVEWRAGESPGVRPVNGRLGSSVRLVVPAAVTGAAAATDGETPRLVVVEPDGGRRSVALAGRELSLEPSRPGLHRVEFPEFSTVEPIPFAVNALDAGESDLRSAESGRWGRWAAVPATGEWRYRDGAWPALLAALAILLLHLRLYLRSPRSSGERVAP